MLDRRIRSILGRIPYIIVKSGRRKNFEIHMDLDGIEILIPLGMSDRILLEVIDKRRQRILNRYSEIQMRKTRFKVRLDAPDVVRRVRELSSQIGVTPTRILVKPMKTMWGSATPGGIITVNARLLKAPDRVVDYIILDGLCHMKARGHPSKYQDLLKSYAPDHAKSMAWLKKNGKFI